MTTVHHINIVTVISDTLLTDFTPPVVQHRLARPYTISLNSGFSHISSDSPGALHIAR